MRVNMKCSMAIISLLIFIPALFSYAKGANNVNDITFSEVQGRYWNLTEVKKGSGTISIVRDNIPIDTYTIKFESKRLTGVGAVNFYFGSYTTDENDCLSINRIACTRVGTLYEIKDLQSTRSSSIWRERTVGTFTTENWNCMLLIKTETG